MERMSDQVKSFLWAMVVVVILAGFTGCKKDAGAAAINLIGTWAKTTDIDLQKYEFKSDSTFVSSAFKLDAASAKVLGIRFKSTGRFRLTGKQLSLYQVINYVVPNNGYGTEADLVASNDYATFAIYSADVVNNTLTLNFDCPSYASCVSQPVVYIKQ